MIYKMVAPAGLFVFVCKTERNKYSQYLILLSYFHNRKIFKEVLEFYLTL